MNPPRIVACYFEPAGAARLMKMAGRWPVMAAVLRASTEAHCPGWEVTIEALKGRSGVLLDVPLSWRANTQKLEQWASRVKAAEDGARILLMDVDTFILRALDDIWDRDFDVAYTTKRGPFPFNAGVMFLRVSDRTRAFMAAWVEANAAVLADPRPRSEWIQRFGGVNQSALAQLLGSPAVADLSIIELPCREWNCEDSTWRYFDPAVTRIAHAKGALRTACFSPADETVETAALARIWRRIEAAQSDARRSA